MIEHGDDTYRYPGVRYNFSSNVYAHFDHEGLFAHLAQCMSVITSYPTPEPTALEARLAQKLGVDASCLLVTSGATEAIYLIAQTFADCCHQIPQPTFAEYAEAVRMYAHGTCEGQKMTWLCNPNNPTGDVRQTEYDGAALYVIDQSYECYTHQQLLTAQEATKCGNILLLHSMTKEYGIPGIRLGYVVGAEALISRIRQRRMPWSVSALAIEAGMYVLAHAADYVLPLDTLIAERQRVAQALEATGAITTHSSDTHILLCCLASGTAGELKEYLAHEHGILIRDASNFEGLSSAHFRIAVQLPSENDVLISAIKNYLQVVRG